MGNKAKSISLGEGLLTAWSDLTRVIPLSCIRSKRHYNQMVRIMNALADTVNDDSHHPLVGLLEILEVLVEAYDRIHHQLPRGKQKTAPPSKKKSLFKPRIYTKRQIAGFILSDALDEEDYQQIRKEVEAMGFDPDSIPHTLPPKNGKQLRTWLESVRDSGKKPGKKK